MPAPVAGRYKTAFTALFRALASFVQKMSDSPEMGPLGGERMLYYALMFLVLALIAGFFGFGGVAGTASTIAQVLFVIFLVALAVTAIANALRGKPPV